MGQKVSFRSVGVEDITRIGSFINRSKKKILPKSQAAAAIQDNFGVYTKDLSNKGT